MPRCNVVTFTTNGTWYKSPLLYAIELVLRGAGGGGASGVRHTTVANRLPGAGGGGGGAARTERRINASQLPATVDVIVGQGGAQTAYADTGDWQWKWGNDGGESSFGDILRAAGGSGGGRQLEENVNWNVGGSGGLSVMRGGNGGAYGALDGQSVTSGVVTLLAGGGGGGAGGPNAGGNGGSGGSSGMVPQGWEYPEFWKVLQSGGGAPGGTVATPIRTPGFPAGGGGGGFGGGGPGSRGGHGLVTVIEYLYDE
jgi:hypothetical protein